MYVSHRNNITIEICKLVLNFVLFMGILFSYGLSAATSPPINISMDVTTITAVTIIYLHNFDKMDCNNSLPQLIRTIEHSLANQKYATIVFGSNFAVCPLIQNEFPVLSRLVLVDTTKIATERTLWYANHTSSLFIEGRRNWVNSGIRMLILDDIFHSLNIEEGLYLEHDNLLFGQLYLMRSTLVQNYPLAALPKTANRRLLSSNVLWVSRKRSVRDLTDFLVDILIGKIVDDFIREGIPKPPFINSFRDDIHHQLPSQSFRHDFLPLYTSWLRRYGNTKDNGLFADENGRGLKPEAINLQSLLAFYQHLFPTRLLLLPVIPDYPDIPRRKSFFDVKFYARGGVLVGTWDSNWIWDSGSWGDQSASISQKQKAKDIQNIDIIDHAISQGDCIVIYGCSYNLLNSEEKRQNDNGSRAMYRKLPIETLSPSVGASVNTSACSQVPYVKCKKVKASLRESPLFNIHIPSFMDSFG